MAEKAGSAYERLVAYVVSALDPNARVDQSLWLEGPDGRREMDVLVQGLLDGAPYSVLIECKDYDPDSTGPVGIEHVDALDSKRRDLPVDAAMICSNSGFTEGALRKGRRKNIGLVSALKADDPRVKVRILQEIYNRIVTVKNVSVSFRKEIDLPLDLEKVEYSGLRLIYWIYKRVSMVARANPIGSGTFMAEHSLLSPLSLDFEDSSFQVEAIDITFPVETQWFSQVVEIDASLGLYDYLRGIVHAGPGKTSYMLKDVDVHGGEPIDFVPTRDMLRIGIMPGGGWLELMLFEGIMLPEDPSEIPDIDAFVDPDDLVDEIPQEKLPGA